MEISSNHSNRLSQLERVIYGVSRRSMSPSSPGASARALTRVVNSAGAPHVLVVPSIKLSPRTRPLILLFKNLHRNVVQELDGIRNGNYQLQFQNRGMKKALQRLRNRLKENIKEPD